MNVYVTYEEVKEYIISSLNAGELTEDDKAFREFAVRGSRLFDRFARRAFYPRKDTRYFDYPSSFVPSDPPLDSLSLSLTGVGQRRGAVLCLDEDLLEVHTLTTKNGDTTISSSDYLLMNGPERYAPTPYDRIRLKPDGTTTQFQYVNSTLQANAVTGIWGWHDRYGDAWPELDAVADNPLLVSATTITVADVDGADEMGLAPRFKAQQLIRLSSGTSAEYCWITSVDERATANTLTVVRGKNGTTAAQWPAATKIYVYRPPADIVGAMLELVAHQYKRRDSVGRPEDRGVVSPTGLMLLPSQLPKAVSDLIIHLRREGI